MRILLATAVALAPLTIAAGAQAQVVISTVRNTPISTSNANGTTADSIRFASGGGVSITSGTAVTIDSSNSVTLETGSLLEMLNASAATTGVLINGGNTGNLAIASIVRITDSIETYPDTDNDGDLDGPWATGSGRYGVRVVGSAPLTGNVQLDATGSIQVEGNDSFGISNEAGIQGNLIALGTTRVVGDRTRAISSTGAVSGNLIAAGTVGATGENATAILVGGDVGGRLTLQGEIAASGYRYTQRGSDAFIGKLDPDDLLQGGPAVVVAGNVAGGVVLDRPPPETDAADGDEDDDGRPDSTEGTATINSFGQAPAVLVGSTERAIQLGNVGTGDQAYGFINRGTVAGQGVYDAISGNALRFGVEGGQAVTISGGVLNDGAITSTAFDADSTAVRFGSGTTSSRFVNSGAVTAGSSSTEATSVAGVRIDSGASLSTLSNDGSIQASSLGGTADVTAILDQSGTLRSITNTGVIEAILLPNDDGDAVTGRVVAIDARANVTGISFVQDGILTPDPGENVPDFPDADGDGVSDADEPRITGDILLGSGNDSVIFRNGTARGDIAFGNGADSLTIQGGAVVQGAISDTDGSLSINVQNGSLVSLQESPTTISGLNVGADGNLIVTVDPAESTNSGYRVAGNATLADGAGVGVRFASLIETPQRFTIIDADTLNYGNVDAGSVQDNSPYLFVVSAGADVAAGDVFIDARRRTAEEADLIAVERQAFDSFYTALDDNEVLLNAFLSQTDRESFINLYEQMLPDHSGGPLLSLASGVDAVTRALTGRNASAGLGETSAWVQEINFYADKDKTDTYGFRSEGFGIAGGVERGTGLGALGVSVAFTSSDLEDPEAEAEEVLSASLVELGLYWRAQGQNWTTWARAAAGYASFDATRALVDEGLNLSNESQWHGFTLAAAAGASYQRDFGRLSVRPEAYVEYFGLSEEDRTEEGGGDGFDLEIDERDGHMFSAVAAVNVGYGFGENGWLRPELRLGWRQNISVDPGETIARFASGGPDFRLSPDSIEGGGPIAGLRLGVGNELGMLSIAADAEMIEDYVRYTLLLRASFRF